MGDGLVVGEDHQRAPFYGVAEVPGRWPAVLSRTCCSVSQVCAAFGRRMPGTASCHRPAVGARRRRRCQTRRSGCSSAWLLVIEEHGCPEGLLAVLEGFERCLRPLQCPVLPGRRFQCQHLVQWLEVVGGCWDEPLVERHHPNELPELQFRSRCGEVMYLSHPAGQGGGGMPAAETWWTK